MNSIVLSVQTLDIVNDVINNITGYGRERKVNFTAELSEEEFGKLKVNLIYNDTKKVMFEGIFNPDDIVEAVKSEDEKEKQIKLEKVSEE